VAALVILALIIALVAGYYLLSPQNIENVSQKIELPVREKPVVPDASIPQPTNPELPAASQPQQDGQNVYPSTPIIAKPLKPNMGGNDSAKLAIIIDDMGNSLTEARSLAAIKLPLTFAIIPGQRFDKDVASLAAISKIEIMIHIPMQSKEWPERRLESNGLLVGMKTEELQDRVAGFVQRFPDAKGVNNHMGSEFTEQSEKMLAVLQILKKNNLFFVDSITSSHSSGLKIAKQLGIKAAKRDVFLDNEQERGYILGQLNQAVSHARKKGSAIAICHPHPTTIAALAAALPGLADQGVKLVSVSELVK
jgi:polysaccharide deacetylase 2 family uncharacterized protein YibQ